MVQPVGMRKKPFLIAALWLIAGLIVLHQAAMQYLTVGGVSAGSQRLSRSRTTRRANPFDADSIPAVSRSGQTGIKGGFISGALQGLAVASALGIGVSIIATQDARATLPQVLSNLPVSLKQVRASRWLKEKTDRPVFEQAWNNMFSQERGKVPVLDQLLNPERSKRPMIEKIFDAPNAEPETPVLQQLLEQMEESINAATETR